MEQARITLRFDASGLSSPSLAPPPNFLLQQFPLPLYEGPASEVMPGGACVFATLPFSFGLHVRDAGFSELDPPRVGFEVSGVQHQVVVRVLDGENLEVGFPEHGELPFYQSIGTARVAIALRDSESVVRFAALLLPVYVLRGQESENIRKLAEYVSSRREFLLGAPPPGREAAPGDLEEYVASVRLVADLYEIHADYFREAGRRRLKLRREVLPVSRLRAFSSLSLQYAAGHPGDWEEALPGEGVRIMGGAYRPRQAMAETAEPDGDTYENRVICRFPAYLASVIPTTDAQAGAALSTVMDAFPDIGRWTCSADIATGTTLRRIRECFRELASLRLRLERTAALFRRILPAPPTDFTAEPRATPVFLSNGVYRQVFEAVRNWYRVRNFDFRREEIFAGCMAKNRLYEYYVLMKMIEGLTEEGFVRRSSGRQCPPEPVTGYREDGADNVFVFEGGGFEVTLYYQPVISARGPAGGAGPALYRRSSAAPGYGGTLVFPGSSNPVYVPDYVIAMRAAGTGQVRYVIADAKYTLPERLVENQLLPLLYRYCLSVAPLREGDRLCGLELVYGREGDPHPGTGTADIANPLTGRNDSFLQLTALREVSGRGSSSTWRLPWKLFASRLP